MDRPHPYLRFGAMIVTSMVVMFGVMYLNTFQASHVEFSETRFYMTLLMGATMVVQMRLTPTPTTDNMQAKIMQFMPIIFTLFCYNFSCALALYSTVNGLFTIGQQLVVNKYSKDTQLVQPATAPLGGNPWKKTKNVTPKKR